jgi:hypothetical protein
MAVCEVCGNDYDGAFEIRFPGGDTHVFDAFECAIHAVAPRCEHCGCTVIGHGVQVDERIFCCAHCANETGAEGPVDRVDGGEQAGGGNGHGGHAAKPADTAPTRPPSDS